MTLSMDFSSALVRSSVLNTRMMPSHSLNLDPLMRSICSIIDTPIIQSLSIALEPPRRQSRSSVVNRIMRAPSSDMWDLQSMETVIEPLNQGIVSLCNVCKFLLDAKVDPNTGMCSSYTQIRAHIEHAEQSMARSEKMVTIKLQNLDECLEQLLKEKGNAEQLEQQKRQIKNQLQIEKNSAKESLKNSKAALQQAIKNLERAKEEIKREEDRRAEGGLVMAAGVGVTFIPLAGWFLGPQMVKHGFKTMIEATEAINRAEGYCEENESKVWENSRKVADYESMISDIQDELDENDNLLQKIQREIKKVRKHLEFTAEIQQMVRRAVTLLSVLSGRVTVLEKQTRRFIMWEPVIKVMEEVKKAVENVAENRLLCSHGLEGFINTLKGNVRGLLALGYSTRHSAHDDYY